MIPPTKKLMNCIMRPFETVDAEPLFKILSDRDVIKYMPWKETPPFERIQRFVQEQIQHWMEHPYGWWALETPRRGEFMGWCGLQYLPETDQTEVGYLLGKKYWGKGIASATASFSLEYGFTNVELDKIVALVHPENQASIHVIEKLGMNPCDRIHLWGMDLERYSILSKDFINRKKNPD